MSRPDCRTSVALGALGAVLAAIAAALCLAACVSDADKAKLTEDAKAVYEANKDKIAEAVIEGAKSVAEKVQE